MKPRWTNDEMLVAVSHLQTMSEKLSEIAEDVGDYCFALRESLLPADDEEGK